MLASVEERRAASRDRARAIVLAIVAALALGLSSTSSVSARSEGDALSTLLGARIGSLSLLLVLALGLGAPLSVRPRWLWAVAAVGAADVTANGLFALASDRALLSLVSVLGSLYPVVTVLLAHVLLGERLTRPQQLGIGVALAGVVAISAG